MFLIQISYLSNWESISYIILIHSFIIYAFVKIYNIQGIILGIENLMNNTDKISLLRELTF